VEIYGSRVIFPISATLQLLESRFLRREARCGGLGRWSRGKEERRKGGKEVRRRGRKERKEGWFGGSRAREDGIWGGGLDWVGSV